MDLGLSGRKALVTAATRGIGLSIAQTLADNGCDVAICARGEGGLESTRKDLEARGVVVFTKSVDVADGDAFKAFVAEAAEGLGGLDVFVSNASGGAGPGEQAWQASFDVDVMGAVRGVGAALPFLSQSDAGSVWSPSVEPGSLLPCCRCLILFPTTKWWLSIICIFPQSDLGSLCVSDWLS